MKTASVGMQAHLAQEVTTLATCWKLRRRDGTLFHFTDHDQDLVVDIGDGDGSATYQAETGYNRTAVKNDDTLAVDNLDIIGVIDSTTIDETELRRGLFNFAEVNIFIVNWADISQGIIRMRSGFLGEVTVTNKGHFTTELRGLTQAFARRIGESYSPDCRADLGDSRCKVPIDPPVLMRNTAYAVGDYVKTAPTLQPATDLANFNTILAGLVYSDYGSVIYRCSVAGTTANYGAAPAYGPGTTVDGTASFVRESSWTKLGVVTDVDGVQPRKMFTSDDFPIGSSSDTAGRDYFPSDSLNGGVVIWTTGNNAGVAMELRDFTQQGADQDFELYLAVPFDIEVGDEFRVYRGCLKRRDEDCQAIFNNVINFRGEPDLPGQDMLANYKVSP